MSIITKGNTPHSYIIRFLGLKIRFRNIFEYKNNKIIVIDKNGKEIQKKFIRGLKVRFLGENSIVRIKLPGPKFYNTTLICGDNVSVNFDTSIHKFANSSMYVQAANSSLNIGKNVMVRGMEVAIKDKEGLKVNIGDDCLIAKNVKIWTTDFHTILDSETKKPLNEPADITIGKHCWLCENTTFLKGSVIPDDTIVAAKAFVTKAFTKTNTIIGGIPADVIKDNNTTWTIDAFDKYKKSLV